MLYLILDFFFSSTRLADLNIMDVQNTISSKHSMKNTVCFKNSEEIIIQTVNTYRAVTRGSNLSLYLGTLFHACLCLICCLLLGPR